MHQENLPTQIITKHACYDSMYDQIYDAAYGVMFTFYDEEDLTDTEDYKWWPTDSTALFSRRYH